MIRFIPKRTQIKSTLWKNYSIYDCLAGLCGFFLVVAIILTNLKGKWIFALLFGALSIFLMLPASNGRILYNEIFDIFKFLFSKKKFETEEEISKLIPYEKIQSNGIIDYVNYKAQVIEIGCKEFGLQSEYSQELDIQKLKNIFQLLDVEQVIDLVKIDRPIIYDNDLEKIEEKIQGLTNNTNSEKIKKAILIDRYNQLDYLNMQEKVYKAFYYFVVYDNTEDAVIRISNEICTMLKNIDLESKILKNGKDVAVFLKYCNTRNFDEREVENINEEDLMNWIKPKKIEFKSTSYKIDDVDAFTYTIRDYPLTIDNAWGYNLFNIDNTKIVLHITPVAQDKAIKRVDKVCQELVAREDVYKASEQLEQQTHISSMMELLQNLQNAKENLYDCTLDITAFNYENKNTSAYKRTIKNQIQMSGFLIDSLFTKQIDAFINSNISKRTALKYYQRGINSSSLASVFPFVHTTMQEENGICIGHNAYPILWNMWKSDNLHRNSNTMIFGKSGGGKTYFLSSLITNAWADDCICFVIDPENEYNILQKNIDGINIDVGNAINGALNPFHIYQILTDGGELASSETIFYSHLKTLESFFRVILENCNSDVLEIINNSIVEVYNLKGITASTDITNLKAEDYPIFDDLYKYLSKKMEEETNEQIKQLYIKANAYIKKFASGGRYSDLWNKPSSLSVDNQFVVFNFQSLFANKNNVVANAQMMLVFRFLEQQVINIREKNRNFNINKHLLIICDEAHLFIDAKFPIALDFFYQMVKRIRKYSGAFIPATQNISDWNANEELKSKSSTVIKNTQYSFVFSLNPVDVEDLQDLYKSNPLNEAEVESIISANMGECFFMSSYKERNTMKIVTTPTIENLFKNDNFIISEQGDADLRG